MELITKIQDLKLRDFVQCACYDNFTVLGGNSEGERYQAWVEMLSQYYDIAEKTEVTEYLKKVANINSYNLFSALIDAITQRLRLLYDAAAAKRLKELYPQFEFSETSFENDLRRVEAIRIPDKVKRDLDEKALEKWHEKRQNVTSPENKHKALVNTLFNINKSEGVAYNMDMSVFEFAVAEKRLEDYILSLQHGR